MIFINLNVLANDRQCSECTKSSSGDSEVETKDLDAPRKLREKIKEPTKWSPDMKFKFEFEKVSFACTFNLKNYLSDEKRDIQVLIFILKA